MKYAKIAVLTGAGISAESGIPVFRSEDGLWEKHRIEDVAMYEGFIRNKPLVHNFYNNMRQSVKSKVPNQGHLALTRLQAEIEKKGGKVTIITQNIDDLHEKAGSHDIIHMHGELNKLWCEYCDKRIDFLENSSTDTKCPHCGHAAMRPDIVWFGEVPYRMDEIEQCLTNCDLFLAVGTSGVVYPAAGFVRICRHVGTPCVEFNLEPSAVQSSFTHAFYGKASHTLDAFTSYLLEHDAIPESLS